MKETIERVLASLENRITDAMHADLTRPFTSEEITQALNQMHPLKSSGLDAFDPSHLITDNVLVAYELNYFLMDKSWGRVGHVFLKLDISKAYDRVEFCFLERQATQEASVRVKHILSQFEEALGLKINNLKLAMVFNKNMRALVEAEFSPLNAHCILGIKLWGNGLRDALVWHYESHGRFLVGSAYRVAYNLSKEVGGSTSVRSWRFIWSSKAPPKVLIFAWRWSRDAMPTSASLRRWGVSLTEGCFGCFADQEDVFHVHFSCPFARLV
ncbi:UNVERIFIED_CONTAM: hypothetical protein Scaly_1810900 [Sesamum calycinum]|uniref:Reverse transcriptase zinc-binding domain-containing protein n=1 Tax=Sesamum calycinum TaxID=2727403 RepID=A0AAW2NES8_9LAMI